MCACVVVFVVVSLVSSHTPSPFLTTCCRARTPPIPPYPTPVRQMFVASIGEAISRLEADNNAMREALGKHEEACKYAQEQEGEREGESERAEERKETFAMLERYLGYLQQSEGI